MSNILMSNKNVSDVGKHLPNQVAIKKNPLPHKSHHFLATDSGQNIIALKLSKQQLLAGTK